MLSYSLFIIGVIIYLRWTILSIRNSISDNYESDLEVVYTGIWLILHTILLIVGFVFLFIKLVE